MSVKRLLYKIAPFIVGQKVVDAVNTEVDTSNFTGHLQGMNVDDVQKLAQAVDNLQSSNGGIVASEIGGIHLNIPSRVDLNTDISGSKTVYFRVYNHEAITHLSLFIDQGGLFSTVAMTPPTSNGEQSQAITIPSIGTSTKRTIVFYFVVNNNSIAGAYQVQVDSIEGTEVSIDSSSLGDVTASNAQGLATDLERAFRLIAANTRPTDQRFSGIFAPFTTSLNIDTENEFTTYAGKTSLYVRSDNARVDYTLPSNAIINGRYPVEFAILNQAGTARFDTGLTPNNTVVIDVAGANNIRRGSETGTLLNFIEAHQNDLVTLTKASDSAPWIANRVTLSNAALLLPSGLFRLQVGVQVSLHDALGFITGLPAGVTPQAGDAFQVRTGNDDFGGYGVESGDVIVALQDNPSRVISVDNDDWLVIRNATNDIISLSQIHFLNATSETDSFTYSRLEPRSDVTNVRVFLSPFILDHAPFINPSTDPDNPQSGEIGEYIGGDEADGADFDFQATTTQIGDFDNVATATIAPNAHMYVDIDGGFSINENIEDVFVQHLDSDGQVIHNYNLNDDFRAVVLTGSTDTYYVLDLVGASDNYSSINYHQGQTINVVLRTTNRQFDLDDSINVISSISDGEIPLSKLDENTQALIRQDHSLSAEDDAKLNGLQTTGNPSKWTTGELYVKANDHASDDLSNYINVGQQNGILSNFDHTRQVTFLVPKGITVTQLERVDNNAVKNPVTSIGTILDRQAFSSTLPASTFDINNPVGDAWRVDGNVDNLRLSGADNSFKMTVGNLGQDVQDLISQSGHENIQPYHLPDNLQRLNSDTSITTTTETGWHETSSQISSRLTREYAMCWSENRRNVTGNFFDDITQVQFTGFNANNIFFYNDGNDQYNTAFPGLQSFIENDNVRVRNIEPGTNIQDVYNKIGGFEYSLQRHLISTDNADMLRLGDTSSTPVIGLSHDEGLYVNVSRQDGGQQTRTYPVFFQVDGAQWHNPVGVSELTEAEVIIPQDLSGSLTLDITIHLDNNGNDEGYHTESITITDLNSDQTIGNKTFNYTDVDGHSGTLSITVDIRYDAVNNDLSTARRVLFIEPTVALNNAAYTYSIQASRTITETWNTGSTYARYPINSGDPHDRFGIFDPELWSTERLTTPEKITWQLVKWVDADQSADPEMALKVIVNGELKGSASNDYKIRMYRPKSDFDTSDINYGNTICAVGRIQEYRYDTTNLLTTNDLRFANENFDTFFGSFSNEMIESDVVTLNAGLIIGKQFLQIPQLTTSERDLLTPVNGMVIYNNTTNRFNFYENGSWVVKTNI